MSPEQIEIRLIASLVAVACALPGVFLVLRRMALMSDAISHTLLLGIVVAFFAVRNFSSPLLIIGAALTGVLTVSLVELLHRTGLVREDAAIGLVFPVLFSLGVILIALYGRSFHLDTDAVLLGAPEYSWLVRLEVAGHDLGPQAVWVMGVVLLLDAAFIGVFYKELKLATFDAGLAAALGFSPALLHYGLMTLVSVTAVAAFNVAGSVLVVAFMIVPAATAYLLTDRLSVMLLLSAVIGVCCAWGGTWLAGELDASLAGAMATMTGVFFGVVLLAAPGRGLLALAWRRWRQAWEFRQTMLVIHLFHHEGRPEAAEENRMENLPAHLRWEPRLVARVVRAAERQGLLVRDNGRLVLTEAGRARARQALVS
jgi:manganese/zinc/iron transport system permease protein